MARKRSHIKGVSRLRRKLKRLPLETRKEAQKGVEQGAELMRFGQLQDVPVDEGDLAQSIEVKMSSDKLSARIGPGVRTRRAFRQAGWRAHFIVFGTRFAPADDFMGRAYRRLKKDAADLVNLGVDRAIRRTARMR